MQFIPENKYYVRAQVSACDKEGRYLEAIAEKSDGSPAVLPIKYWPDNFGDNICCMNPWSLSVGDKIFILGECFAVSNGVIHIRFEENTFVRVNRQLMFNPDQLVLPEDAGDLLVRDSLVYNFQLTIEEAAKFLADKGMIQLNNNRMPASIGDKRILNRFLSDFRFQLQTAIDNVFEDAMWGIKTFENVKSKS